MNGQLTIDDGMYLLAALAGFNLETGPAREARERMRLIGLFDSDGKLTAIGKGVAGRAVQAMSAELQRLL